MGLIPQTGVGRLLFYLHIALIAALWIVPLAAYQSLPEQIPVHFDFAGNADRYAPKSSFEMLLIPIIGTFIGLLAIALLRYPESYNVPRRTDIASLPLPQRTAVYDVMREMLLAIFLSADVVLLGVLAMIIGYAHATVARAPWLLIAALAAVPLAVTYLYLVRVRRAFDAAKRAAGMR